MNFLPKSIKTEVKIDKNLLINAKKLISELDFGQKRAIFISDEDIFNNCCEYLNQDFKDFLSKTLILTKPKADEENLEKIRQNLEDIDLIIALGSGTVSDLCKYSSFKNDIPYVIFASAPSMNGYLSQNASITISGHKKTLAAKLPEAIFCDIDILKNAPVETIKAGIGDSMCFYGCWFDWLLSHLLLETKFEAECFSMLFKEMSDFVGNYKSFSLYDDELLAKLIKILLLSGASMTIAGSSSPASQSEHLISHSFSMRYPDKSEKILHGLQIATTSLISSKIQEELISQDYLEPREPIFLEAEISDFFGDEIMRECRKEYEQKLDLIRENKNFLRQELTQNWQSYSIPLSRILIPENNLKEIFDHFKIETGPKALGIDYKEFNQIISYAKFIRNRFTCLDL